MTAKTPAPLAVVTGQPSDLVPLAAAAEKLHTTTYKLLRLSRRGEFPPLLQVTRKHWLVRRADLDAWIEGRWTTAAAERAALVTEAVRGGVRNRRAKGD